MSEFAPNNKFITFMRICVEGLASVPSIIFGLFGIAIFVEAMGIWTYDSRRCGQFGIPKPACFNTGNRRSDSCGASRDEECFVRAWRDTPSNDSTCSNPGCSERDYHWNLSRRRPCIRGERCNHPYCGGINLWRDVGFQLVLARGNTCRSSMVRSIGSRSFRMRRRSQRRQQRFSYLLFCLSISYSVFRFGLIPVKCANQNYRHKYCAFNNNQIYSFELVIV